MTQLKKEAPRMTEQDAPRPLRDVAPVLDAPLSNSATDKVAPSPVFASDVGHLDGEALSYENFDGDALEKL